MAPVVKYQLWDNAAYPWTDQTPDGMMGSIVAQIDAWAAIVNTNSSIVADGMSISKVRDPNSSTNGGTRNGFVYKFVDGKANLWPGAGTDLHVGMHGTETQLYVEAGDEYEDDTQNNGFGDWGSTPGHYTQYAINGTWV